MRILRQAASLTMAATRACASAACAGQPAPPPFVLSVEGDALIYRGALRGDGAIQLTDLLRDRDRDIARLVITSPGGDGPEALRVGEAVRDRRIAVEVDRFCISACAIYVFPAGQNKTITPGSIVAYHISPSLAVNLLRAAGRTEGAHALALHREATAGFYRSLGVDIAVLDAAATLMQPVCLGEDAARPVEDPARYMIAWRYGGFIPSREQLAAFGIDNVQGWWPREETLRPMLRTLGFRDDYRPLYAPEVDMRRSAEGAAPSLPQCPASLLRGDQARLP